MCCSIARAQSGQSDEQRLPEHLCSRKPSYPFRFSKLPDQITPGPALEEGCFLAHL